MNGLAAHYFMTTEQTTVELNVKVSMLTAVPKRELEVAFRYPPPAPAAYRDKQEIDPNIVAVQLRHEQERDLEFVFNMLISKEHAQKLGLMVGDKVKLKIIKEG
jgi:hypothetical protein